MRRFFGSVLLAGWILSLEITGNSGKVYTFVYDASEEKTSTYESEADCYEHAKDIMDAMFWNHSGLAPRFRAKCERFD